MNQLYPIYLKLARKRVLVIGGGPVALRRVERLVDAGALVTLVSPTAVDGLRALRDRGLLEWKERELAPPDVEGSALVFLAAGDPALVQVVREETARRGILFSSAEDEAFSDFHIPAVASWGKVTVAVSTGGESPSGGARIRDLIEEWLSERQETVAAALERGRTAGPAGRAGAGAVPGKVYLVGAGPGAPGLLTLRAAELLRTADVVLFDRLIPDAILERVSPRAQKIYVGKEAGCPVRADIEGLLIAGARAGKVVVRLKGGDPLVFGRGGEEMAALRRAGVDYEVVPGVSALNAVPASAGIPVTLRDVSSELVVRSGHRPHESDIRSGGLSGRTYVYFMAAGRLAHVAAELLAEGLPGSTPVAVIQKGTLPAQRTILCTLESLAETAAKEVIETPALLVAGEVVRHRSGAQLASPDLEHALESLSRYVPDDTGSVASGPAGGESGLREGATHS